jgi:hypothetical protein
MMKQDQLEAGKRFLNWMEKTYPGSKAKIIKRANAPIATAYLQGLAPGLGQFPSFPMLPSNQPFPSTAVLQPTALPEPEPVWYEKLADAAATIVPAYISYKQQDKLTDMQIERMKRDLPPIEDPGRYMAPTVKIAHQIDTAQLQRTLTPSKETQNLLWIAGGAAALMLFIMFQK